MTLSEKIWYGTHIKVENIKEFIKKLKAYLNVDLGQMQVIDKLAGKELIDNHTPQITERGLGKPILKIGENSLNLQAGSNPASPNNNHTESCKKGSDENKHGSDNHGKTITSVEEYNEDYIRNSIKDGSDVCENCGKKKGSHYMRGDRNIINGYCNFNNNSKKFKPKDGGR